MAIRIKAERLCPGAQFENHTQYAATNCKSVLRILMYSITSD